jgi:hypothetical protein
LRGEAPLRARNRSEVVCQQTERYGQRKLPMLPSKIFYVRIDRRMTWHFTFGRKPALICSSLDMWRCGEPRD